MKKKKRSRISAVAETTAANAMVLIIHVSHACINFRIDFGFPSRGRAELLFLVWRAFVFVLRTQSDKQQQWKRVREPAMTDIKSDNETANRRQSHRQPRGSIITIFFNEFVYVCGVCTQLGNTMVSCTFESERKWCHCMQMSVTYQIIDSNFHWMNVVRTLFVCRLQVSIMVGLGTCQSLSTK